MADQIIIDYVGLGELATSAADTTTALDAVSAPPGTDFEHSPRTVEGIDDFDNEWDERRGELVEGLEAVTNALSAIAESFAMLDEELGAALEGGG